MKSNSIKMIVPVLILVAIVVALLLWNATSKKGAVVAEASRTEGRGVGYEENFAPTENANAVAVNEGIPNEAPHPPSESTNVLPVWNREIRRWSDYMWSVATNGVIALPESRIGLDSEEAIEYVRIARTEPLVEGVMDNYHSLTVDVYDENAMVAFEWKKQGPQFRGRTHRIVIIDIKTKTPVRVHDW